MQQRYSRMENVNEAILDDVKNRRQARRVENIRRALALIDSEIRGLTLTNYVTIFPEIQRVYKRIESGYKFGQHKGDNE